MELLIKQRSAYNNIFKKNSTNGLVYNTLFSKTLNYEKTQSRICYIENKTFKQNICSSNQEKKNRTLFVSLKSLLNPSKYTNSSFNFLNFKKESHTSQIHKWFSGGPMRSTKAVFDAVRKSEEKKKAPVEEKDDLYGSHAEKAVITAIAMNLLVTLGKGGAFLYTGSGTVLSEAIHSLADTANQSLLWIGLQRAKKDPSVEHPYGFGMEKFVWALVSAVGIFFLGSGLTLYHGISTLLVPHTVESLEIALGVLGGSLVLEGYSFYVAFKACREGAKELGLTLKDYLFRGPDPMVLAVLMEDMAALIGVGIAGFCVGLTSLTNNTVWDSVGTIAVGTLLGFIASILIERNRSALVGRAIPTAKQTKIVSLMEKDVMIRSIHDVKAVTLGTGIRFKAEVDFNGEEISKKYIQNEVKDINALYKQLDTPQKLEQYLQNFGEGVVDQLGKEVDRIEEEIKKIEPEVRYVDIETH